MVKKQEHSDDALLDGMVEEALRTRSEQSALKVGEVINRSNNADAPFPMVVGSIEQPGLIAMYDTRTRELSWSDENNIRANLRKTHEDGSPVFTLNKPSEPPFRGDIKCRLHREDPERAKWDELGFPSCRKATLASQYQADRHLLRKHPSEAMAIKEAEYKADEADRKADQKRLIQVQEALITAVAGGPKEANAAA